MADEISRAGAFSYLGQPGKPGGGPQGKAVSEMKDCFVAGSDLPAGTSPGDSGAISGGTQITGKATEAALKPSASLWDEAERLGLIHAGVAVPGPIGQSLSEAARRELLDLVTRLQEKGVDFGRKRPFRIPLAMNKYVPATPEEVADAFSQDGSSSRIAYSRAPGPALPYGSKWVPEKNVPVSSLEDLRGLDGVYGAGVEALPPGQQGLMEAVNDLMGLHWQFGTSRSDYYSDERSFVKPFEVWRALREGRDLIIARMSDRDCIRLNRDGLLAMAMLETGKDHGVENPDIIRNIIALRDGGAGTGFERKGTELELYHSLCRKNTVRLALGTQATLSLSPADIADPPAVLSKLKHLDDLYQQYLAEPLHRTINGQDYYMVYDFCTETGTRFSPHVRAAALRDLFPAASNRHGYVEMSFLFNLERRLETNATDELHLKRLISTHMDELNQKGYVNPGECLELPPEVNPGTTQQSPEHTHLLGIYRQFLEAARSEKAATEGLDLVRMPAGDESEEERVKLFLDLAEASTDENRTHTADAYRAVLAHRRPNQSLAEAGCVLLQLMKQMNSSIHQDRALEVFAELQQGPCAIDDEMLTAFGKTLVASGSVDDALSAARRVHSTIPSETPSINTHEDMVSIGGISLKRQVEGSPGSESHPLDHQSGSTRGDTPVTREETEAPGLSREEIDRDYLGEVLRGRINSVADFEPLYEHLLKPHPNFSSQARAAAMRDLIPVYTSHAGYLDVRELIAQVNRIEKRPANDIELAWLTRNYIATINERHGPYGTDAEGPKGPHISTPPDMFQDLLKKEGGGEFAVLLMTTTRAKVRKWMADKLVESANLDAAHTGKERAREARASLLKLLEDSTGSSAAGADALNMISISVGAETEDDRLKLLLDLAGADRKELAARHYRTILMHRRPDQDLLDTGHRYLDVLKSLSAVNQQDRSAEVFAALQKTPARAIAAFTRTLSRGSTVDEALQSATRRS